MLWAIALLLPEFVSWDLVISCPKFLYRVSHDELLNKPVNALRSLAESILRLLTNGSSKIIGVRRLTFLLTCPFIVQFPNSNHDLCGLLVAQIATPIVAVTWTC